MSTIFELKIGAWLKQCFKSPMEWKHHSMDHKMAYHFVGPAIS